MNNYMNNSLFFNDLDSDPDINTNNSCLFKNNYIIESDEIYKYLKPNIVNNETNYNIKKQDNVINGTKETKEKINREKHSQIEKRRRKNINDQVSKMRDLLNDHHSLILHFIIILKSEILIITVHFTLAFFVVLRSKWLFVLHFIVKFCVGLYINYYTYCFYGWMVQKTDDK